MYPEQKCCEKHWTNHRTIRTATRVWRAHIEHGLDKSTCEAPLISTPHMLSQRHGRHHRIIVTSLTGQSFAQSPGKHRPVLDRLRAGSPMGKAGCRFDEAKLSLVDIAEKRTALTGIGSVSRTLWRKRKMALAYVVGWELHCCLQIQPCKSTMRHWQTPVLTLLLMSHSQATFCLSFVSQNRNKMLSYRRETALQGAL